jgi:DNA-binding MarR family transcriptional regulator
MAQVRKNKVIDLEDNGLIDEFTKERIKNLRKEHDIKVTTIIQEDNKVSLKSQFVITFLDNFDALINLGLNNTEMKVISYILKKMEFVNLLNLNQVSICKALNLGKSNVSKIFTNLYKKKVLVKDSDGNTYVNANLFAKGLKHKMNSDSESGKNLIKSQAESDCFTKSF